MQWCRNREEEGRGGGRGGEGRGGGGKGRGGGEGRNQNAQFPCSPNSCLIFFSDFPQWWIVVENRWSPGGLCIINMDTVISKTPMPRTHVSGKVFPGSGLAEPQSQLRVWMWIVGGGGRQLWLPPPSPGLQPETPYKDALLRLTHLSPRGCCCK
jgi:hypothetical protein